MRHKDHETTKRYINMAIQLNRFVEGLHVPDVLKLKKAWLLSICFVTPSRGLAR